MLQALTSIFFVSLCATTSAQEIVPFGSSWEYLHPLDGVDPALADPDFGTTWHTPATYDGLAFHAPARAPLGYGTIEHGPIATNIGTPLSGRRYTAYFRASFVTTEAYPNLQLDILADDGGVLYIDGIEVARINLSGPDQFLLGTDQIGNEFDVFRFFLSQGLAAGEHVVAFSLHNASPTSSDLGFDLRLLVAPSNPTEDLTWSIDGGEVTITGAATNVFGTLEIPSMIEGLPVTAVGDDAFEGGLWSGVTIPDGVVVVGDSAFRNCTNLASVTIPEGLTSIGNRAFEGCTSLASLTIPDGVTSIGSSAFEGCTSLTSLTIPDGVTSIGSSAFERCTSLTSLTIPEGLTSIGNGAFVFCSSLASITIPEGPTSIGSHAFYFCSNLIRATIPESVTSIKESTFTGCSSLTELTFKGPAPSVDTSAFSNIPSGAVAFVQEDHAPSFGGAGSSWNGFLVLYADYLGWETADGELTITRADDDRSGLLTIPAVIGGLPVTKIGAQALAGSLWSAVAIPSGVTSIGAGAFLDCQALAGVTIPAGVTSIGSGAFQGCSSLESITIPGSATSIGDAAFSGCASLAEIIFDGSAPQVGPGAFSNVAAGAVARIHPEHAAAFGGLGSTWNGLLVAPIPDYQDFLTWWTQDGSVTITGAADGQSGTLVIPSTIGGLPVTAIGSRALRATDWTSVTIRPGVASIGNSTFSGCTSLASITIPEGVTSIGTGAFSGCTSLASIRIPEGVRSIGASAFSGCTSLASVTLPEGITSIGESAFYDCTSLASQAIPEGTTSIGKSAFEGCTSLASLTIPGGVASVEEYTFSGCTSLASVTLPEGITSIGKSAFEGCTSLASITLPENLNKVEVRAFNGTAIPLVYQGSLGYVFSPIGSFLVDAETAAGVVVVPRVVNGLPVLSANAFAGNELVTNVVIPEGVTTIGSDAFGGCSFLVSVAIPSTVALIVSDAFDGCPRLAEISFMGAAPSASVTTFWHVAPDATALVHEAHVDTFGGVGSIWNKLPVVLAPEYQEYLTWAIDGEEVTITKTAEDRSGPLTIPGVIGGLPVTKIGAQALAGSLWSTVTIPSGVTSIGAGAFLDCQALVGVTIHASATSIENGAFQGCFSLENVTILGSVTSIGSGAFQGCSSLGNVTIPGSVTAIGNSAFSGCATLAEIVFDGPAPQVGSGTFSNVAAGAVARVRAEHAASFGGLGSTWNGLLVAPIPDYQDFLTWTTEAGRITITGAADGRTGTLVIPPAIGGLPVTAIGNSALSATDWTSVAIRSGVTSIGSKAFSHCTNLANVTIPDTVTSIGSSAFHGCTSLASVTIPEGVTSIGSGAFFGCTSLASVTIPESVASIESIAFFGCTSLASITIPEGVTSIGISAFSGCTGLTSITIPESVTSIGFRVFYGCTGLASITIPESVTSIGFGAFSGCTSLASITIPEGVTSIGSDAFSGCISLASITIPEGVTAIGSDAFSGCTGLASVTIPDAVTSIESGAFFGCTSLASITIPENVLSIWHDAFLGCTRLAEVVFEGVAPSVGWNTFAGIAADARAVTTVEHAASFGGVGATWNGLLVVGATLPGFDATITANGLVGDDALPEAAPFSDGLSNLAKYAFNMDLAGPDHRTLSPGGVSGLPLVTIDGSGAQAAWRIEFVRRKVDGLEYAVTGTRDLLTFEEMSGTSTVTDIDQEWERVVFVADVTGNDGRAFARVEVTLP